jgi:hypothetical protein
VKNAAYGRGMNVLKDAIANKDMEEKNINMEETFEDYLKEARRDFAIVASKYPASDHLELRMAIDSLLIAYDQAVDKALIAPDGYMLTQSASYNEIKLNLSDTVEKSEKLICYQCNRVKEIWLDGTCENCTINEFFSK